MGGTGRTDKRLAGPTRPEAPTWQRLSDIPACIWCKPNRMRTAAVALIVGTVLFLINHLDATLRGRATTGTWVETGMSFVVPFCVANLGLLVATRSVGRSPAVFAPTEGPGPPSPTWQRLSECPRCVAHRPHLVRTATIALVVGTIYFLINQLSSVLAGQASLSVWLASGFTYLVPFTVSNVGVLVGCRRPPSPTAQPS
jgi:hypothetical protein